MADKAVRDPFCIDCMKCVSDGVCPVPGALGIGNGYRILDRKT